MRRHVSMEQLARDVLLDAHVAVREKNAAASRIEAPMATKLGKLLAKVAAEIRNTDNDTLTYADIAAVAEVRRGQR